jgi:hypothetical protein
MPSGPSLPKTEQQYVFQPAGQERLQQSRTLYKAEESPPQEQTFPTGAVSNFSVLCGQNFRSRNLFSSIRFKRFKTSGSHHPHGKILPDQTAQTV